MWFEDKEIMEHYEQCGECSKCVWLAEAGHAYLTLNDDKKKKKRRTK